jgi:hypothetical protein
MRKQCGAISKLDHPCHAKLGDHRSDPYARPIKVVNKRDMPPQGSSWSIYNAGQVGWRTYLKRSQTIVVNSRDVAKSVFQVIEEL